MITTKQIQHMAKLVRIEVSSGTEERIVREMSDIVEHVSQVQELAHKAQDDVLDEHRNIFRTDGTPHESGLYTKEILKNVSKVSDEGSVVVPKIL